MSAVPTSILRVDMSHPAPFRAARRLEAAPAALGRGSGAGAVPSLRVTRDRRGMAMSVPSHELREDGHPPSQGVTVGANRVCGIRA